MHPAGNKKKRKEIQTALAEFYGDIQSHIEVANIIKAHLTESGEICRKALQTIDLSKATTILDLGCGFGYFTRGLKGVVSPGARIVGIDVHAAYKGFFLEACAFAGLNGKFESRGVRVIEGFGKHSFDLVISSYSLYFFPEYIPQITRLLKPGGHFLVITHAEPHMLELTFFIRGILQEQGFAPSDDLPYELLIRNFNSENGFEMLKPWFEEIKRYKCKSALVFKEGDTGSLLKYLRFKEAFFLPGNNNDRQKLLAVIAVRIEEEIKQRGSFSISKDDYIFICSGPIQQNLK